MLVRLKYLNVTQKLVDTYFLVCEEGEGGKKGGELLCENLKKNPFNFNPFPSIGGGRKGGNI